MHKKKIITVAALSLAAVLIVGTFAWTNFSANIINVFTGLGAGSGNIDPTDPDGPGGTLHNDHADGEPYREVYIENWGTEPLIVRINLSEYMEMGPGAGITNDPDQNQATSLVDGASIDDVSTWTPFNGDLESMIRRDDAEGGTFRDYWQWEMGGQKYFFPAPAEYRTDRDAEVQFVSTSSPWNISGAALELAQQTLNAEVISMSEWVEQGEPMGNYWVVDTDGFSYWAAPLSPGDATGLLLHKVELINPPVYDYFYAINVAGHMATVDDSPDNYEQMIQDASSNAERLIRMLADSIRGEETAPPSGPLPARSVRLSSLEYYSSEQYIASPWDFLDEGMIIYGSKRVGDVFVSGHRVRGGRGFSSRDYLLDGQYSRISGRFFIGRHSPSQTSGNHLVIYGDGVQLYSSPNIRSAVRNPHLFDVDVSGVSVLRMEFVFARETGLFGGLLLNDIHLGISDTQLLLKPTSEPLPTPTPDSPVEPVRLSSIDYFTNVFDNASLWMGPSNDISQNDILSSSQIDRTREGFSYRNYVINGQYSRITGNVHFLNGVLEGVSSSAISGNHVVIWGDGMELYRSPVLGNVISSSFDLDISGISDLTIGFEFGILPDRVARTMILGISDTQLIP